MRRMGKVAITGFSIWVIVFAVASILFQLRDSERALFESVMPVALTLATATAAVLSFRGVSRNRLAEGLLLGVSWLIVNLVLDLLIFSQGPMQMSLAEYLKDIGLTYWLIPTITTSMGVALEGQARSDMRDAQAGSA